jgi:UDP-glucose 4-epimerase
LTARRPAAAEPAVALTGVCGRLGRLLLRRLHREARVVGIDRREFPDAPPDLVHYRLDLRRKACRDVFRREPIRALVHLGAMHDPRMPAETRHAWNVEAFGRVLDYVAAARIPKLVLLSSAAVYGARPGNAQFLSEEAPLLASGRVSEIRDLVELDMLAQTFYWRAPECETVVLRPAFVVGHVRNEIHSYFSLPVTPRLLGFDPMMQFVHEDDLVEALRLALRPGVRGIYNVAGPGVLPLSEVIERVGRPSVAVPHPLARRFLDHLWRLGFSDFPGREIDYLRFVCMVDDRRARQELGYQPRKTLEETIDAVRDAVG